MTTNNKGTKVIDPENKNPDPKPPSPAIGELQSSAVGSMDLANLRRMYGDSYGTSGYGLINLAPQPGRSNSLTLETWFNNTKLPDVNHEDLISEGIKLLKMQFADFNSITHLFGYQSAEMSIHLGKILIKLKSVARKTGEAWGAWATEHLPFIKARTREKFMNLAKRRDCHKYSVLGAERLDVLCTATKDFQDEDDPIGAFMAKHNVTFDPTREFILEEFKEQIDIAIDCEKVETKGFVIPRDKVAALHKLGRDIDQTFIKSLMIAQQSGGSPETVVDRLILNGGKDSQVSTPEQRLADFNTSASRMLKTLDYIIDNQDHVDLIDRETYRMLMEKLSVIQALRNMNSEKPEQAVESVN
jgi:hypothetical protein